MEDEMLSGFTSSLSGQDTPQQAATKEEIARKMQDRIRVCNITDDDFSVKWDGYTFIIPAKTRDLGYGPGQQVLPRYLAINYLKKMTDEILGKRLVAAVQSAIAERVSRGQPKPNHYEERLQIEAPFRIDNVDQRNMLVPYLWLGVEEEYGMQLEAVKQDDQAAKQKALLEAVERPAKRVDNVSINPDDILGAPAAPELPTNAPVPTPQVSLPIETPSLVVNTPAPTVNLDAVPITNPAVDQLLNSIQIK